MKNYWRTAYLLLVAMVLTQLAATTTATDRSLEGLTGLQDVHQLTAHADSLKVPHRVVWAIAWQEGRSGSKGNNSLGQGILVAVADTTFRSWDSNGKLLSAQVSYRYKRVCREIGRLQLNPCVDWVKTLKDPRCTLQRIKTSYDDNVHCGVVNMKRLYTMHKGWTYVPSWYNGGSAKYQSEAEVYIGHLTLKELR